MKNMKITKSTDIQNDLLMIEIGHEKRNPIFYLCFHEKTGAVTINFPLDGVIDEFEIEEFQKLVERLKVELKQWAVNVSDQN
jgi:hypothetical protein